MSPASLEQTMTIAADTTYLRVCDGYPCMRACICPLMNIRVRVFHSGQLFAECIGLLDVLFAPSGNGHQKGALLDIVVASRQASDTSLARRR